MTRYIKSMSETLQEVDEIAKTIPEVAPPGWGHTVAKKEKTKPNKPKSKIGGTAHEFQKDLDSGKFKGLPGDKTKKDRKASMFKLMWSMKNKGDKPHYKPGVKDKLKSQYKEEVEESNLPPHLSKFLDKEGNPNPEAAKRIEAGRKKRAVAAKIKDVTPKGYGPKEEVEMDEARPSADHPWRSTPQKRIQRKSDLGKYGARVAAKRRTKGPIGGGKVPIPGMNKEEVEMAIMSIDHKEAPRKLKITQKGLDALRADRDRPKVKTVVKLTKKGREAIKDEVEIDEKSPTTKWHQKQARAEVTPRRGGGEFEGQRGNTKPSSAHQMERGKKKVPGKKAERFPMRSSGPKTLKGPKGKLPEGRFASPASDPRIGGSSSVDTVPDFALKAKKGATSAPGSGSIAKAKKAKASDVNKSIEQQMADAMKESTWSKNFKANAAKRRGETKRRREAERDSPGQRVLPKQKDEDTNRYWHSIKEAQWKVKLKGLPTFYVPGKSAGAIRQMLRKQLKRPMDDIEDITRATPAAKKKDFRTRAQGKEDSAVVSGKT